MRRSSSRRWLAAHRRSARSTLTTWPTSATRWAEPHRSRHAARIQDAPPRWTWTGPSGPTSGTPGLTAPSLVLRHDPAGACDGFCEAANADFATVKAAGNSQQLSVAGSQHLDFSDLGLLRGPGDPLPVGPIDAQRMTLIIRDLVRSFLDEHVTEAPAAGFTAAIARYPELR